MKISKMNIDINLIIIIIFMSVATMANIKNDEWRSREAVQTNSSVETTKKGGELRAKAIEQKILTPHWIPDKWPMNLPERQQFVESIKDINATNLSLNNGWKNNNKVDENDNDDDEYDYEDDDNDNTFDDETNYDRKFAYLRQVRSYPLHVVDRKNNYPNDFNNEDDYQSDQPIGDLTNYKEQNLGNPAGVQSNFEYLKELEQQRNMNSLKDMAKSYRERVYATAGCKVPKLKLIYPTDITKNYDPRAAMLHRCDDSTGCCRDPQMSCQAIKEETVYLPFYESSPHVIKPKMIAFTNHTLCACVMPLQRRKRNSSLCQCPEYFTNFGTQRDHHHNAGHDDNDAYPYAHNYNDELASATSSSCRCDCHLNNSICQRLKNGEEGFPMSERKCILNNNCNQPICNYGLYNRYQGRCPSPDSIRQNGGQQQQRGHG